MISSAAGTLAVARVRHLRGPAAVEISLPLGGLQGSKTFNRPAEGSLAQTLSRMSLNLGPKKQKKQKRPKKSKLQQQPIAMGDGQLAQPRLRSADGEAPIDGAATNASAWHTGAILEFGPTSVWRVASNLPAVLSLAVPGSECPMVGYPLHALATVEFADKGCQWVWSRVTPDSQHTLDCVDCCYTPTKEDVGHCLQVSCAAIGADGEPAGAAVVAPAVLTTAAVSECPADAPGSGLSLRLLREG